MNRIPVARPLCAFVFALTLLGAESARALEKAPGVMLGDRSSHWSASNEFTIAYYNICTGWVWVWGDWDPNDVIGVTYTLPDQQVCTLNSTWWFFGTGAPAGYGYTGTMAVHRADASGCPTGAPLAEQAFVPISGWNVLDWGPGGVDLGAPSQPFTITYNFGAGWANPAKTWTDHPAAGPTGPASCGTCFPTTRENRSFYFGTTESPLCPGSPFNDGVCDAQFLQDVTGTCLVTSVEPSTWSSVKGLYR